MATSISVEKPMPSLEQIAIVMSRWTRTAQRLHDVNKILELALADGAAPAVIEAAEADCARLRRELDDVTQEADILILGYASKLVEEGGSAQQRFAELH
jgi:3-oxoacyl-[acyl-carrier-protein] synthase III